MDDQGRMCYDLSPLADIGTLRNIAERMPLTPHLNCHLKSDPHGIMEALRGSDDKTAVSGVIWAVCQESSLSGARITE